jgi:hypothetical protein
LNTAVRASLAPIGADLKAFRLTSDRPRSTVDTGSGCQPGIQASSSVVMRHVNAARTLAVPPARWALRRIPNIAHSLVYTAPEELAAVT